jgi:hypothetical protein
MSAQEKKLSGDKVKLLDRFRQMDRAAQRKLIKFVWSGLLFIVLGLVLIAFGLSMHTGAYSAEGLLTGFGAIVVIVGVIRLLIGFINPLSPSDLDAVRDISATEEEERQREATELDEQLFEQ